jgi:hypothetical protein
MFAAPASYAKRRVRGKSQKERGASFERRLEVDVGRGVYAQRVEVTGVTSRHVTRTRT